MEEEMEKELKLKSQKVEEMERIEVEISESRGDGKGIKVEISESREMENELKLKSEKVEEMEKEFTSTRKELERCMSEAQKERETFEGELAKRDAKLAALTSQARADSDLSLQSSSDLRAAEEKLRAAMAEIEALKKGAAKVEVSHAMKMKQLRDELEATHAASMDAVRVAEKAPTEQMSASRAATREARKLCVSLQSQVDEAAAASSQLKAELERSVAALAEARKEVSTKASLVEQVTAQLGSLIASGEEFQTSARAREGELHKQIANLRKGREQDRAAYHTAVEACEAWKERALSSSSSSSSPSSSSVGKKRTKLPPVAYNPKGKLDKRPGRKTVMPGPS